TGRFVGRAARRAGPDWTVDADRRPRARGRPDRGAQGVDRALARSGGPERPGRRSARLRSDHRRGDRAGPRRAGRRGRRRGRRGGSVVTSHRTVEELMTPDPISLPETASVLDAAQTMRDASIGNVVVLDGHTVSGIVTDRDIVVRGVAAGRDPSL